MSQATAPKPSKVLRALFWKLIFRGRSVQQASLGKNGRQLGLLGTSAIYVLVGIWPSLAATSTDSFVFASLLHVLTLLFASLSLAASVGSMLFIKEEGDILLHRPVTPREMLRAKCWVIVGTALILALSLNLVGFAAGIYSRGSSWRFVPAHLLSTILLMVFSVSCLVLVYNVCLKWLGRERWDNAMATMQSLMAITMVVGGQIVPRMLRLDSLQQIESVGGWALALPPVWFAALDALLAGSTIPVQQLWLPAALGLVITAFITWLALERLGGAYGQGLMGLNESQGSDVPVSGKPRGRWLDALLAAPPLKWWLRDAVERQSFRLTAAYMFRDREVKQRLYPGIAPMLVMPVIMLFPGRSMHGAYDVLINMQGFVTCFLGIVPLQALLLLNCSENWRASAFFRAAPLAHWSPLFHGSRKAVLCFLVYPLLLLEVALVCWLSRSALPLMLALPAMIFLPTLSLVSGLSGMWLPFARPSEEMKNSASGCFIMLVTMVSAGMVGGMTSWMLHKGWFWTYFAALSVVLYGVGRVMKFFIRDTSWSPPGE